jgi:diguanylate cyclase
MHEESTELKARLDGSIREIASLQQGLEIIWLESRTDALAGMSNRKHFDEVMTRSIGTALAQGEPLSLLPIDVDRFKSFNDNHGHLTGDHVLRLVARSIRKV